MALLELKTTATPRELRQFGAIIVPLLCALVGAWLARRGLTPLAAAIWALGAVSFVIAWRRPQLLRPVFIGWMLAAYPIGWTVSHLLMAVIYFMVVAPIGIALRLAGHDPLERKFDRAAKSYWKPREKASDPARYFRQF